MGSIASRSLSRQTISPKDFSDMLPIDLFIRERLGMKILHDMEKRLKITKIKSTYLFNIHFLWIQLFILYDAFGTPVVKLCNVFG